MGWLILALTHPTTTYHFAPLLTAVAWPIAFGRRAEIPSVLREDEHVDEGIRALDLSGAGTVPVLAADGDRVVGWFDYRAALRSFR